MIYRTVFAFFAFFMLLACGPARAETLWVLGQDDGKDGEFVVMDVADYLRFFPSEVCVDLHSEHPEKSFPAMLAGPSDRWAGSRAHTYSVQFDCPDLDLSRFENPHFEFALKGIVHWGALPRFQVNLNGVEQTIDVNPKGTPLATLFPNSRQINTLRAVFPKDAIKKKGNKLSITQDRGGVFHMDCIRFELRKGDLDRLAIEPIPGIFRTKDNGAARSLRIHYDGESISAPIELELNVAQEGKTVATVKKTLTPNDHPQGDRIEFFVPSVDQAAGQFDVTLSSNYKGKKNVLKNTLPEQKRWTVRVLHQTHLDIGYTHPQEEVLTLQVQSLKDAVKYIEETADYPEEARFRFHPEGMWAVEEFMRTATEDEKKAFIRAAKSRYLHLDILFAQAMTGMYNDEELFELMGSAVRFGQEHDIVIDTAMQSDVPGYTWGLIPSLVQNGVRYLNIAPNPTHRVGHVYDWGDKPFYWESPSGQEKVLCWIVSTSYNLFHWKPVGHRFSDSEIFSLVDTYEKKSDYDYDFILLRYCIEKDNGRPNRAVSDAVLEWNEKYHFPKLLMTTNSETMYWLEKEYGPTLPTVRGDFTPYWEDGAASTSEATGINRISSERIVQAETLCALMSPENYPKDRYDDAWTELIMYDEHTWGAMNSISEPDSDFAVQQDRYKQQFAQRGAEKVRNLTKEGLQARFSEQSQWIEVVNTSSWPREEYVFVQSEIVGDNNAVVDENAANENVHAIPSQKLSDGRLVFYSGSVPPFGTKRFRMANKADNRSEKSSMLVQEEAGIIDNGIVRLQIDPISGSIVSLKHKEIAADLVRLGDDGNRGINDYLYIIGRDAKENRTRNENKSKITVVERGPCMTVLRVETDDAPNCKSLVRLMTVYANSERIDVENRMDKIKERRPEGSFFGFPLNVEGGLWRMNIPWATIQIEKDQLLGANRNYYPAQRFVNFSNSRFGVDLVNIEATMYQFAPLSYPHSRKRDGWLRHIEPGYTLYSWVCNNHWETNYKADQSGLLVFRYTLRPRPESFNQADSERFAREVHQPLIAFPVKADLKPIAAPVRWDNAAVIATRMKPLRFGKGLLLRLYNAENRPNTVDFQLNPKSGYSTVHFADADESRRNLVDAPVLLLPNEIRTFRIE